MDFKQQYKTEMQNISPSEEQCERIRAKVYEAIQNPQSVKNAPGRKKPLPLKAIAITGASAACLVLVAALAVQMLPKKNNFTQDAAGGGEQNGVCAIENTDNADVAEFLNDGYGTVSEGHIGYMPSETMDGTGKSDAKKPFEYNTESDSGMPDAAEPAAPGSLVVKMVFSEDMSECEVYEGSKSQKYTLSNEAPLTDDSEALLTELPAINSNIEKTLFIYTSGDKMWVYDENKFIGCFIQIS